MHLSLWDTQISTNKLLLFYQDTSTCFRIFSVVDFILNWKNAKNCTHGQITAIKYNCEILKYLQTVVVNKIDNLWVTQISANKLDKKVYIKIVTLDDKYITPNIM